MATGWLAAAGPGLPPEAAGPKARRRTGSGEAPPLAIGASRCAGSCPTRAGGAAAWGSRLNAALLFAELPEAERPPKLEAPDGGLGIRVWLPPSKAVLRVAAGVGALPVVCSAAALPGVPPSGGDGRAALSRSPASVLPPRPQLAALLPLLRPNRRFTLPQAAAKMPRCLLLLPLLPAAAGGCAFAGVCGSQDAMGSQLAGTWDGGSKGSSSAAVLPPGPGDVSRACLPRRKPHMPPLPCGRSMVGTCGGAAAPAADGLGDSAGTPADVQQHPCAIKKALGRPEKPGLLTRTLSCRWCTACCTHVGLRSGRPGGRRGSRSPCSGCRPAGALAQATQLSGQRWGEQELAAITD